MECWWQAAGQAGAQASREVTPDPLTCTSALSPEKECRVLCCVCLTGKGRGQSLGATAGFQAAVRCPGVSPGSASPTVAGTCLDPSEPPFPRV